MVLLVFGFGEQMQIAERIIHIFGWDLIGLKIQFSHHRVLLDIYKWLKKKGTFRCCTQQIPVNECNRDKHGKI